jgi:hypothetical protein
MGLDQFAKVRNPETGEVSEIAYWRKHNALHGWMENRYRKQNPDFSGDFNCVPFELKAKDLDDLEFDIHFRGLPETNGFFFGGDSRFDDRKKEETSAFIQKARNALAEGMQVAYDSWW